MSDKYDVSCKFDIEKHKETYINYLEVLIDIYGEVHYAVPSHQEYLINEICKSLQITRDALMAQCPQEYYYDMIEWLCKLTHNISVWSNFAVGDILTCSQGLKLVQLHNEGLYTGPCPATENYQ